MLNKGNKQNLIEIFFALQFTTSQLQSIEETERFALENVSDFALYCALMFYCLVTLTLQVFQTVMGLHVL